MLCRRNCASHRIWEDNYTVLRVHFRERYHTLQRCNAHGEFIVHLFCLRVTSTTPLLRFLLEEAQLVASSY